MGTAIYFDPKPDNEEKDTYFHIGRTKVKTIFRVYLNQIAPEKEPEPLRCVCHAIRVIHLYGWREVGGRKGRRIDSRIIISCESLDAPSYIAEAY